MTPFIQLFISFVTIGLFGFGGGYAILAFVQQEVERQGWMSMERFADLIAISQSTPGAISINMATFVGYQVGFIPGALIATFAVILPGVVFMILLARFFFHLYEHATTQAIFGGLRPVVVGLIASAAWTIGKVAVSDVIGIVIALVTCVLIAKWRLHPIFLVAGAAVAGILFF